MALGTFNKEALDALIIISFTEILYSSLALEFIVFLTFNNSSILFGIFIFALFIIEKFSRKKARYHLNTRGGFRQKEKIQLFGGKAFLAFIFCFIIFLLSFLFPLSQMLYWTIKFPENLFDLNIIKLSLNTIYLVLLSSFVLISFSLISNITLKLVTGVKLGIMYGSEVP